MFFNPFIIIKNSFKELFTGFFNITGRIGQTPFITVTTVFFIFAVNLPPISIMLGIPANIVAIIMQTYLLIIGTTLFFASIRRAHDVGFTALLLMVLFIPYVGPILTLVFLFWKGEPNRNRWGDTPSDAGIGEMIQPNKTWDDDFPY